MSLLRVKNAMMSVETHARLSLEIRPAKWPTHTENALLDFVLVHPAISAVAFFCYGDLHRTKHKCETTPNTGSVVRLNHHCDGGV